MTILYSNILFILAFFLSLELSQSVKCLYILYKLAPFLF